MSLLLLIKQRITWSLFEKDTTRLLRGVGRWARKPVNHTSWVAVVTPTDRPKSVRNCCLIELFCGVVCVVTLSLWHFCWYRGFCHRTGSDLLLFVCICTKQKRSTEGCSKFKSPETRQVQERLVKYSKYSSWQSSYLYDIQVFYNKYLEDMTFWVSNIPRYSYFAFLGNWIHYYMPDTFYTCVYRSLIKITFYIVQGTGQHNSMVWCRMWWFFQLRVWNWVSHTIVFAFCSNCKSKV